MRKILRVLTAPRMGNTLYILGIIGALLAVAGAIAPGFLAFSNIMNLLRQAAPLGIICIGQTLTILTAGVDLSVGSMAIFTNILSANILQGNDSNNMMAFAVCLAAALIVGLINGFAVAKVGINPFVMTLAMGIVVNGAALVYSNGAAGGAASPMIKFLGVGRIGPIPLAVILWAILAAVTLFALERTTFSRKVYAVGANRKTARLSGVNVPIVLIACYALSSVTAMIAGLLVTGTMGVGTFEWGFDYRLISMAAVTMGGTVFSGGSGGYAGSCVSAFALILLNSLLTIVRISEPLRQMIYGLVILFSLWASTRKR